MAALLVLVAENAVQPAVRLAALGKVIDQLEVARAAAQPAVDGGRAAPGGARDADRRYGHR